MTTRDDVDAERIEAAALRAWPALEEVRLERWTLRFSDGFTGRANSVQTGPGSTSPVASRVATCEAWYAKRGLSCAFRLLPFSEPGLDDHLAEQGYTRVKRTDVLRSDALPLASPAADDALRSVMLPEWMRTFGTLSEMEDGPPAALGRIVASISTPALLGVLTDDSGGTPVACGLAVVDGDLVGLFDLRVRRDARRQGWGAELVRHLVRWGMRQGATTAYLQVQGDNVPAARLYGKLGFRPAYEYWYRVRTT